MPDTTTPQDPATDPLYDPEFPHWRRNMRALFWGNFCQVVGMSASMAYLPLIVVEMGAVDNPETWVGLIMGVLFTLSFLLSPVWSGVADHFGNKPMILRAGLGMGVGYAILAFVPDLRWYIAMMLPIAFCNGYTQAVLPLIAGNTPSRYMGRAISAVQTGQVLGSAIGPILGALTADHLPSYQMLLLFTSGGSAVAGFVAWGFVRERWVRPQQPFRLHLLRDLRICLAVPMLGVLYLLSFVSSMAQQGSAVVATTFTLHLVQDGASTYFLTVPQWLGVITLGLTLAGTVGLPLWGRLLDRLDPVRLLMASLLLSYLVTLAHPFVSSLWALLGLRVLFGLLFAGTAPATVRLQRAHAPPGMVARAIGFGNALYLLGNAASPVIAGLIGPWLGLRAYWVVQAAILLVALFWWVLATRSAERRG